MLGGAQYHNIPLPKGWPNTPLLLHVGPTVTVFVRESELDGADDLKRDHILRPGRLGKKNVGDDAIYGQNVPI